MKLLHEIIASSSPMHYCRKATLPMQPQKKLRRWLCAFCASSLLLCVIGLHHPTMHAHAFLQEGHTAHATPEEAEEMAMRMVRIYEQFAVQVRSSIKLASTSSVVLGM